MLFETESHSEALTGLELMQSRLTFRLLDSRLLSKSCLLGFYLPLDVTFFDTFRCESSTMKKVSHPVII